MNNIIKTLILFFICFETVARVRWSSFHISIIGNDVGEKDNKFLSFVSRKKRMEVATTYYGH